jgi:hypothetical protein
MGLNGNNDDNDERRENGRSFRKDAYDTQSSEFYYDGQQTAVYQPVFQTVL